MNENILIDVLVFTAGMTAILTIGRIIQGWITRKSAPPAQLSSLDDRLRRIEQIVEASAIEIERISESQRFTTKLLADRASSDPPGVPAGTRAKQH